MTHWMQPSTWYMRVCSWVRWYRLRKWRKLLLLGLNPAGGGAPIGVNWERLEDGKGRKEIRRARY